MLKGDNSWNRLRYLCSGRCFFLAFVGIAVWQLFFMPGSSLHVQTETERLERRLLIGKHALSHPQLQQAAPALSTSPPAPPPASAASTAEAADAEVSTLEELENAKATIAAKDIELNRVLALHQQELESARAEIPAKDAELERLKLLGKKQQELTSAIAEKDVELEKLKLQLLQQKRAGASAPVPSGGGGQTAFGGFLAKRPEKPSFGIVALIYATGSDKDRQRMKLAEQTWLTSHGTYRLDVSITWIFALCKGDPGTQLCPASVGPCPSLGDRVVQLPCKHSYQTLIGKGIEGYRYIAENYNFKYVLKADIDSIMDVPCAASKIAEIPDKCRSWGLGLWRIARDSKVFGKEDEGKVHRKYINKAYRQDTGNDWYPPYMTGWAFLWSADVARFLGMGGLPGGSMPTWRDTWSIEDAAIGTFIAGLDICKVSLANKCSIWTEMEPKDFHKRDVILASGDEDALAALIEEGRNGELEDFEGPLNDDIENLGDLANVQAKSLQHCAAKCFLDKACRSIEFSKTVTGGGSEKNCQLVSIKHPRARKRYKDYKLYSRKDV